MQGFLWGLGFLILKFGTCGGFIGDDGRALWKSEEIFGAFFNLIEFSGENAVNCNSTELYF